MLVTLPASGCGLFPEKVGYFTLKLPESEGAASDFRPFRVYGYATQAPVVALSKAFNGDLVTWLRSRSCLMRSGSIVGGAARQVASNSRIVSLVDGSCPVQALGRTVDGFEGITLVFGFGRHGKA